MSTDAIPDRVWMPTRPWACPGGRLVMSSDLMLSDRPAWLDARRAMLGASDTAAVLGVSKWGDPFTVWADKTGRTPTDNGSTVAQRRGQLFEDAIVKLWAETSDYPVRVRRAGLMVHREHAMIGASVDRLSVCPMGTCVVEIKSNADLAEWSGPDGEPEVPVEYQVQVLQQLMVTGRTHAHVVVLGPRFSVLERVVDRDREFEAELGTRLPAWWAEYVTADMPPAPGSRSIDLLSELYAQPDPDSTIVVPPHLAHVPYELAELKQQAKSLDQDVKARQALLRGALGNGTTLVDEDGTVLATWKPTVAVTGAAEWAEQHPEEAEPFTVRREVVEVDGKALAAARPELLGTPGGPRRQRSFLVKVKPSTRT